MYTRFIKRWGGLAALAAAFGMFRLVQSTQPEAIQIVMGGAWVFGCTILGFWLVRQPKVKA